MKNKKIELFVKIVIAILIFCIPGIITGHFITLNSNYSNGLDLVDYGVRAITMMMSFLILYRACHDYFHE